MFRTAIFLSPLQSLKVFAFLLPRKPKEQQKHQDAVRLLPNLENLQIFVQTGMGRDHVLNFIQVLPELPNVSSLRVCASGTDISLPSETLEHISHLELGLNVTFSQPPSQLSSLVLERLDTSNDECASTMSALRNFTARLSVELSSFEAQALQFLPGCTQKLELHEQLAFKLSGSFAARQSFHTGFGRFTMLKAIYIAEYVSPAMVYTFEVVVLPFVHTLGLVINSHGNDDCYNTDMDAACVYVRPAGDVTPLTRVFPRLQRVVLTCFHRPFDNYPVIVDAAWMHYAIFPGLQSIVCRSPYADLRLQHLVDGVNTTYRAIGENRPA